MKNHNQNIAQLQAWLAQETGSTLKTAIHCETIHLNEHDWTQLVDELDRPPVPNEALRQARQRHRLLIG